VRYQHDHLRNSVRPRAGAQEFVRQLRRRHHLEPEQIPIEMERALHVAHPQNDLREPGDRPGHVAIAAAIAARFASRVRGGTEQPGATSRPRPPVSPTTRRTSASISGGGPYSSVERWPSPPITALPLIRRPSTNVGLPWLCTDQLIACAGRSRDSPKCRLEPHRCATLNGQPGSPPPSAG